MASGDVFRHVKTDAVDCVQRHLDDGTDPNCVDGDDATTLLHWAAYGGNMSMVQMLLERHASTDLQERDGKTPLHWAGFEGHAAVVRLLLARGAAPVVPDRHGHTACYLALLHGHDATARLFPDYAACVVRRERSIDAVRSASASPPPHPAPRLSVSVTPPKRPTVLLPIAGEGASPRVGEVDTDFEARLIAEGEDELTILEQRIAQHETAITEPKRAPDESDGANYTPQASALSVDTQSSLAGFNWAAGLRARLVECSRETSTATAAANEEGRPPVALPPRRDDAAPTGRPKWIPPSFVAIEPVNDVANQCSLNPRSTRASRSATPRATVH